MMPFEKCKPKRMQNLRYCELVGRHPRAEIVNFDDLKILFCKGVILCFVPERNPRELNARF